MAFDGSFSSFLTLFGGSIYHHEYRGNFTELMSRAVSNPLLSKRRPELEEKQSRTAGPQSNTVDPTQHLAQTTGESQVTNINKSITTSLKLGSSSATQSESHLQDDGFAVKLFSALQELLTGEVSDAEQILQEISSNESGAPDSWKARAEIYRFMILEKGSNLRAFPGCHHFNELQTPLFVGTERLKYDPSKLMQYDAIINKEHINEFQWVFFDVNAVHRRRGAIAIPPSSPVHDRASHGQNLLQLRDFHSQLENARRHGFPEDRVHLLNAEMAFSQNDGQALALMDAAALLSDEIGKAYCEMRKGDMLCSHHCSSITALNMGIYEALSHDGSFQNWDEVEDSYTLQQPEQARLCYDRARSIFVAHRDGGRGAAAIDLRLACLAVFQGLRSSTGGDTNGIAKDSEAALLLESAMVGFKKAGDKLSLQLVLTHRIILDIFTKKQPQIQMSREIGKWGKETGSLLYAHDLGLLLSRLGSYVWRTFRSFDISMLLLEAADELMYTLGASGSWAQTLSARASVLAEVNDLMAARVLFLSAERRVKELFFAATPRTDWITRCETVQIALYNAMLDPFATLGERSVLGRILETSSKTGMLNESREVSALLAEAIIKWKEKRREHDLIGAETILREAYMTISAFDTEPYREAREAACSRVLVMINQYELAKQRLRDYHQLVLFEQVRNFKGLLLMAINAQDLEVGKHCMETLVTLGKHDYRSTTERLLDRNTEALYALSWLHEGLQDQETAIHCVNALITRFEGNLSSIGDSDVRLTSFARDTVVEAFDAAVRISLWFHDQKDTRAPVQFGCIPPLRGKDWEEQALIFAERGKARSLLESLLKRKRGVDKAGVTDSQSEITEYERRQILLELYQSAIQSDRLAEQIRNGTIEKRTWAEVQLALEAARSNLLEERLKEFDSSGAGQARSRRETRAMLVPPDISEIAESIPADTIILEYATTFNGVAIFAITNQGIVASHWSGTSMKQCRDWKEEFLWLMTQEDAQTILPSARVDRRATLTRIIHDLSMILVSPVEDALRDKLVIVLVPSGEFFNFPLGLLESREGRLASHYNISQVPSLAVWYELRRHRTTVSPKIQVLCESVASRRRPILGSAEAATIARACGIEPLMTDTISNEAIAAASTGKNVFQCVSHGLFDRDVAPLSTLDLLPRAEQQMLDMLQLVSIVGPAQLVVLSACESAYVQVLGSNDGYGFSHTLLANGVKSFIGTLWKVEDAAALLFMVMFYQALIMVPTTIGTAFMSAQRGLKTMTTERLERLISDVVSAIDECDKPLAAQLFHNREVSKFQINELIKDWDPSDFGDPYYWAAFNLTGDSEQHVIEFK